MFNYGYDRGIERLNFTRKKGVFLMQYPFFHFIFHIFVKFCTKQYQRQRGFKLKACHSGQNHVMC